MFQLNSFCFSNISTPMKRPGLHNQPDGRGMLAKDQSVEKVERQRQHDHILPPKWPVHDAGRLCRQGRLRVDRVERDQDEVDQVDSLWRHWLDANSHLDAELRRVLVVRHWNGHSLLVHGEHWRRQTGRASAPWQAASPVAARGQPGRRAGPVGRGLARVKVRQFGRALHVALSRFAVGGAQWPEVSF